MYYPRITIVVLNFNGLSDTDTCIKSLLKTDYPNFRIIIADNGSKINESKILEKRFKNKRIKFIRFSKNLGFSGGNNKILKKVKDKYVVLLNNDTEVTPKWLYPLVNALESNSNIATVQPKILSLSDKRYFDYAGACGGFIDIFGYPFTRGRIFNTQERDKGQYDSICDIFWTSGAAMIIRRNIFDKVGYFDERFFNYMEEIDLCFRIHCAGFCVMCESKSVIYHKGAASSSKNEMKKRFWEHRNSLLLLIKNYPLRTLVYVLPVRIILEYVSIIHYIFSKRFDFVLSVILSQISFLYLAPSMLLNKRRAGELESLKNKNLILKNSIAIKYFILKKRKYSEIMR